MFDIGVYEFIECVPDNVVIVMNHDGIVYEGNRHEIKNMLYTDYDSGWLRDDPKLWVVFWVYPHSEYGKLMVQC